MNVLFSILTIITSILLILVVLMQKSKGSGLSSSFSSSNSILGYKKTTDIIEKVTWILATVLIVLCLASVSLRTKMEQAPAIQTQSTAPTGTPLMNDMQQTNETNNNGNGLGLSDENVPQE